MAQTQTFRGTARTIVTIDGKRYYSYHRTAVVIVDTKADTIRLDSGGWLTVTTKTAMNQVSNQDELGFRVFARDGDWFVSWMGRDIPFRDGMTLDKIPAELAA